ncbi:MAG: hypothetical protein HY742_00920 [Deltaproteobacteria bacterium]|nr:hypothetical protein [Deltaproteobacteria bacterium]
MANKTFPVSRRGDIERSDRRHRGSWPVHGWIGLGLVGIFWTLNWSLSGLRTHWGFFPLWLGYGLAVDALVFCRRGDSLFTRDRRSFAELFLCSVPAWWLFELINLRTENWLYEGKEYFSAVRYFLFSSLSFSTVMPAMFGTAELAGTFRWIDVRKRVMPFPVRPAFLRGMFAAGGLMLALLLVWPRYFFPFVWLALYFLLEPINFRLGNRTLVGYLAGGDWRPVLALAASGPICGFFWEMWNFYSFPRWVYRIPFVDVVHVFEMPLAGYAGYLTFPLELFALYHLLQGILRPRTAQNFIRLTPVDSLQGAGGR